ncbi:MAG: putative sec-independent protein translocase protein [Pseudobdellovibrio sp.]|jgi:Sec-independent protein translocase protein TatA|nr:putative sec-independent protein translocase protein [Pseudobdellovibrio sp.]
MSFTHMIILGIIALIVIPPEKLPEVAREIARFISDLKNSADQIMGELKRDAVFKPEDILDKNIKQKLADLQKDLNQTISIDPKKPAEPVIPPVQASGSSDGSSSGTDGSNKS